MYLNPLQSRHIPEHPIVLSVNHVRSILQENYDFCYDYQPKSHVDEIENDYSDLLDDMFPY